MKREEVLKEMKNSVGTKDPVEYFRKMTDVLGLLFDRIDRLENTIHRVRTQSALAIKWEPKVASNLLSRQVEILRQDKATYFNEISALMKAFAEDEVTQNYDLFCEFWVNTLGWHPFLD